VGGILHQNTSLDDRKKQTKTAYFTLEIRRPEEYSVFEIKDN
jgi:hypothetical protein